MVKVHGSAPPPHLHCGENQTLIKGGLVKVLKIYIIIEIEGTFEFF